jgi:hypothetical protein
MASTIANLVDGGKRLRATVVLAVSDALAGNRDHALRYAAVIECVHAASLVHDDLVDDDRMRRGRPATWIVHGARRAVLLADVMFATALQRSGELRKQGVVTVARAIAMLAAGAYGEPLAGTELQVLDGVASYERTIRLKCGSLFAAAAELGAIAARARPGIRRAAFEFGMRIGEAYQIADDLDDMVHNGRVFAPDHASMLDALLVWCGTPHSHRERISSFMEAEIGRRLALARGALDGFGEGARTAGLRELPSAIVPLSVDSGDDRGAVQREVLDVDVPEAVARELGL